MLESLLAREASSYLPPFHMSMAYVGLGDFDQSFGWLDRAVEEHDPHALGLNIVPAFRPLRSDPRFGALLKRIGLVE